MGAEPEPKRWMLPLGSLTVSVPCVRRDNSLRAVRAAAGASPGMAKAAPSAPALGFIWVVIGTQSFPEGGVC